MLAEILQKPLARVQRPVDLTELLLQRALASKEPANRVALRWDSQPAVLLLGHLVSPARGTHAQPLVASVKDDPDMRGASRQPRRVLVRAELRDDEKGRRRVSWATPLRSRAALWGEQSGHTAPPDQSEGTLPRQAAANQVEVFLAGRLEGRPSRASPAPTHGCACILRDGVSNRRHTPESPSEEAEGGSCRGGALSQEPRRCRVHPHAVTHLVIVDLRTTRPRPRSRQPNESKSFSLGTTSR